MDQIKRMVLQVKNLLWASDHDRSLPSVLSENESFNQSSGDVNMNVVKQGEYGDMEGGITTKGTQR